MERKIIVSKEDNLNALLGYEDLLERILLIKNTMNYPPYNIIRKDRDIILEIALAGFNKDELMISLKNTRELIITGQKKNNESNEYLYKGIAQRSFTKTFILFNDLKIKDIRFINGMLYIHIYRENNEETIENLIIS